MLSTKIEETPTFEDLATFTVKVYEACAPDSAVTVTVTVFKPGTKTSSPETTTVALSLLAEATTTTEEVPLAFATVSPALTATPSTVIPAKVLSVDAAGTMIEITVFSVEPS